MTNYKSIKIFDTTLRDGEQSPGASLNIDEKVIIARQLKNLGVDIIEAGFPISSQGDYEAVKRIAQEINGPIICALARAQKADIDRAWDAIKHSTNPRIHTFIATSQIHMDHKLRKSKDEVMNIAYDAVSYAKKLCDDVEFTPEDSSRTDIDYMCDVVRTAIAAGATTINIADTVGYAQPEEFYNRIITLFEKVPEARKVIVSAHCHDDLGLAVANSLAAIRAGATQIECTINGIGERAGNCALEEVVMNLKIRKNYFGNLTTGINTKEIYNTSQLVSELTGIAVQRNKAIVGQNAFAHEAGIHQHGVLQEKKTYEIMDPKEIGWCGEKIIIGKHSGKHAIESVLVNEGYNFDQTKINNIVSRIKNIADINKTIAKSEILKIASEY